VPTTIRMTQINGGRTSTNIYVGNLSPEVTEEELRQEFAPFGEVSSVSIMKDKYRGHGFVEMPLYSQGQVAIISLNGKTLRNQVLSVIEALPLSHHEGSLPRQEKQRV